MSKRAIFVGNLPFDATEEQIRDFFEDAGPVNNVRLVFDRETGKPKGHAFVEFFDEATAHSAVRNLHNRELGGRPLRVSLSLDSHAKRGAAGPDQVVQIISGMAPRQLSDTLSHLQELANENPERALAFLSEQPQLTFALYQALLMLELADPADVAQLSAPFHSEPAPGRHPLADPAPEHRG